MTFLSTYNIYNKVYSHKVVPMKISAAKRQQDSKIKILI